MLLKHRAEAHYADIFTLKTQTYTSFCNRIQKYVGSIKNSLEVGCGSALASVLLSENLGVKCSAIDNNREAISYATDVINSWNSTISVCVADAFYPPFEGKSFDLVFNFGTIEHYRYDAQNRFIESMKHLSNGYIVVGVPNETSDISAFSRFRTNNPDYDEEDSPLQIDIEQLFDSNGIKLIEKDGLSVFLTSDEIGDDNEWLEFQKSLLPYKSKFEYQKADIQSMCEAEANLDKIERVNRAFMVYYVGKV